MTAQSNRAPNTAWYMRRALQSYPNGYVRTTDGELVQVVYFEREGYPPQVITLDRRDARLLAKRINECLDATVRS